jgi:hypothetical protein
MDRLFDNKTELKFLLVGFGKHAWMDAWIDGLMD